MASPEDQPYRPALRLHVVGAVVLVLFVGHGAAAVEPPGHRHKHTTRRRSPSNQVRTVTIPPARGLIVDRNDTVLAGNQVTEQIVLSRVEASEHPEVVGEVAALVGQTPAQVEAALKSPRYSPYEPVPVLENVPTTTVQYLEDAPEPVPRGGGRAGLPAHLPPGQCPGDPRARLRPLGGYVGELKDRRQGLHQMGQIGRSGLEMEYERYLRGVAGQQALSVNSHGDVVGVVHQTRATQGDTVVTNIDLGLQEEVESALTNVIQTDRKTPDKVDNNAIPAAPSGAAIVLNPQNGQVLAMASYPSYNLNEWVGGISQSDYRSLTAACQNQLDPACPLTDYAIDGLYTPGLHLQADHRHRLLDRPGCWGPTPTWTTPGPTPSRQRLHRGRLQVHRRRGQGTPARSTCPLPLQVSV